MNFNYEKAKELLIRLLNKKKEEAKENGNDLRLRNIDILLVHDGPNDYLEKLLDIVILSNIANAVGNFNTKSIIINSSNDFLFSPAVEPQIQFGTRSIILANGDIIEFSTPEEMRKYLYEKVGFEYQSHEQAKNAKNTGEIIIDPLATYEEVTYGGRIFWPSMFNLIDDIDQLEVFASPVHSENTSQKGR